MVPVVSCLNFGAVQDISMTGSLVHEKLSPIVLVM